jgi:hypothetical protein
VKKTLISLAVHMMLAAAAPQVTRARTRDVAFQFRMGAGFPGDINRVHPFSVLPGLMNTVDPIRRYGDPAIAVDGANGMTFRGFKAGDTRTVVDGILVRSYPTQQTTGGMASTIGTADAPTSGVIDTLEEGFIMVKCEDFAANPPSRAALVTVRIAATSGQKVQGGFHAAADGGNTVTITNARWNGAADASGFAELRLYAAK